MAQEKGSNPVNIHPDKPMKIYWSRKKHFKILNRIFVLGKI